MIKVKIYLDKEKKQEIELLQDQETIGRSRQCTLRFADGSISAVHCSLTKTPEGVILKDTGSTNGTFVNEEKVDDEVYLKIGDRIRIGRVGLLISNITFDDKGTKGKKTSKGRNKKNGRPLTVRKKGKPLGSRKKDKSSKDENHRKSVRLARNGTTSQARGPVKVRVRAV